jgi:DNA-binding NarL/FixJ family response regulator
MPGLSGFEATRQLKKALPTVPVILVTMLTEFTAISEAFQAGASGYVLKQSVSDELYAAIDDVTAGKRFLSKQIDLQVREAFPYEWFRPKAYSTDLTRREREVLVLLTGGPATKQIAQRLNISMKAMQFHNGNLRRKLGVYTISDLIKFALDKGLTVCEPL